ncbi:hypothetical protein M433DRAFT_136137 [Acidomyces richmondensis BFW]|nr:hypothetical protein M433DRAFT_136137 [Acidomyces richmondensis BFW]
MKYTGRCKWHTSSARVRAREGRSDDAAASALLGENRAQLDIANGKGEWHLDLARMLSRASGISGVDAHNILQPANVVGDDDRRGDSRAKEEDQECTQDDSPKNDPATPVVPSTVIAILASSISAQRVRTDGSAVFAHIAVVAAADHVVSRVDIGGDLADRTEKGRKDQSGLESCGATRRFRFWPEAYKEGAFERNSTLRTNMYMYVDIERAYDVVYRTCFVSSHAWPKLGDFSCWPYALSSGHSSRLPPSFVPCHHGAAGCYADAARVFDRTTHGARRTRLAEEKARAETSTLVAGTEY